MPNSFAIIIAGAFVASAVLFANHWQIALGPVQKAPNPQVYRLNKWTGEVVTCSVLNPQASPLDAGEIPL